MLKEFIHKFHDEKKSKWTFLSVREGDLSWIATWKVECYCGVERIAERAYGKRDNELTPKMEKNYSLEKDGDLYYTMCGHTKESAVLQAIKYKGDNYHV